MLLATAMQPIWDELRYLKNGAGLEIRMKWVKEILHLLRPMVMNYGGTHNSIVWNPDTTGEWNPGPAVFVEVLVFNGGTGRFENATGEFREYVEIFPKDESGTIGTYILSGEGTITY